MKSGWSKVIKGVLSVAALGALVALLSSKKGDEFQDWLNSATDEELADGYERRRQQWMKTGFNGNGEKTPDMNRINDEISNRVAEKWEKGPRRNTDPNFRWTDANRWDKD